jgi:2-haloacid dehalogenase
VELAGIAFDAFGTLFDLSALRTRTRAAAGHEGDELFAAFRNRLIPWTWHATAADDYEPFPSLAAVALQGAALDAGFPLERSRADWIVEGLRELPVFEDVQPGLERLAGLGLPLAVLSNGTLAGIEALVAHNGLEGRFRHLIVADAVRSFKPAAAVYDQAPRAFGVTPERVMLVSGHEWDVAGAGRFGMSTAWIARGERFAPVRGVEPDVFADDLVDLADKLAQS